MRSILDYIKVFKNIETYKGPGPRTMAQGGRIGFSRAGLASYPPFRGRSGADNLKAWRGQEMLEALTGAAIGARGAQILTPKDEEVSEDLADKITTKVEKDAGGGPEKEPPQYPYDPEEALIKKTLEEILRDRIRDKERRKKLKKEFKEKAWVEKPIVTGSPHKGTRKSIIPGENIDFFEDLNNYANQEHAGNLKAAIRKISGVTDSKKINSLYTTIQLAAKRRDFKFELQGLSLPQDLLIEGEKNSFSDLTTILKTNPDILKDKINELVKKGIINRTKVYNKYQLAEIFGVDITSGTPEQARRQASRFMEALYDNGARWKPLPGDKKGFALYDAQNALLYYSKLKQIRGEGTQRPEQEYRTDWDPEFETFRRNLYRDMQKTLSHLKIPGSDIKLVLPEHTAQVGHNPVPIAYKDTLDMFKDKKLVNKIFSLNNTTWQDKDINRDVLMSKQGTLLKHLKTLDRYYGKVVTKNSIGPLTEARDGIEEYFIDMNETAKEMSKDKKFIKEDVIAGLTLKVPKIGEKLTEKFINVDMSNVGSQYIMGNIDLINKKAVKFSDLNLTQKKKFAQNVLDQKITQLKDYYKDAEYPPDLIEDIIDALLVGTMKTDKEPTEGILEKELFKQITKKAKGGPVEVPTVPWPMQTFAGGGMAGIRRPSSLPPTGGPMSQGLRSLYINDRDY